MVTSGSRLEAVLRAGQSRLQATGGGLPAFKDRQKEELAEREKLAALYIKIFGSDDESGDDEKGGSGGNALDGAKSDDDDHDSNATIPYGLKSPSSRDEMDVDSESDGVEPEEDQDWYKGLTRPKVALKLQGNGQKPSASQQMKDDAAAAMRLHEEMKRATARETRRPARMVPKLDGKSNVTVEEEWW